MNFLLLLAILLGLLAPLAALACSASFGLFLFACAIILVLLDRLIHQEIIQPSHQDQADQIHYYQDYEPVERFYVA